MIRREEIIIAMLTSSNNSDDVNTALNEYGLPAYIYKPLTSEKLQELFDTYFPDEES